MALLIQSLPEVASGAPVLVDQDGDGVFVIELNGLAEGEACE